MVELNGGRFLELEDVAHGYRRPCIMDVKLGRQTWYPGADPSYIQRCRARDAATMQAVVGFRICGLQVHKTFSFLMSTYLRDCEGVSTNRGFLPDQQWN